MSVEREQSLKSTLPAQGDLVGDGLIPDRFLIRQRLGRGAHGHVFLAWDSLHEREVALKLLQLGGGIEQEASLHEARALARIRHPNVVTVYELVLRHEPPFLVMEYVEGEELERLIQEQSSLAFALKVIRPVVAALVAAHEAGVLHRDVKPSNVMVGAEGRVKLIDFGVARRGGGPEPGLQGAAGVEAEGVIGTPYFVAPELLRGQEADERADLYAVGATLFRVLTRRHPYEASSLEELRLCHERASAHPPSVRELRPETPVPLDEVIRRCLAPWAERYASASELLRELDLVSQTSTRPLPSSPYVGLQPLSEEERGVFFGREEEVARVLSRLRTAPMVTLVGASGAGKSSLALAGVAAAMAEGALDDGRDWRVLRITPGRRPLEALAAGLLGVTGRDHDRDRGELERLLAESPQRWWQLASDARPGRGGKAGRPRGLLLVVDQLEELVTICIDELQRDRFGRAVGAASAAGPGVRVLATARDDFLARLGAIDGIAEALNTIHLVRPLDGEALRAAVEEPARAFGFTFESEAMVERIVQELAGRSGTMPLLQFAMEQLWDERDPQRRVLPNSALERMGSIGAALARSADDVAQTLAGQGLGPVTRLVLLELLTPEGTKRSRSLEEIVRALVSEAGEVSVRAAVGRLRASGMITGGEEALELAHEALATEWALLRRWVEETRALRELAADAQHAARRWLDRGRPVDLLWHGERLREAGQLLETRAQPTEEAAAFVQASLAQAARRRRARRLLAIGAIVVVCVAVGLYVRGLVLERDLARQQTKSKERIVLAERLKTKAERERTRAEEEKRRALERWIKEREQLVADLRKARSRQLQAHILGRLAERPRAPTSSRGATEIPAIRTAKPGALSVCVFGPADDLSMAGDWQQKTTPASKALRAGGFAVGCEYPYVRSSPRFSEATRSGLLQHGPNLPRSALDKLLDTVRPLYPKIVVRRVSPRRLFRTVDLLVPE